MRLDSYIQQEISKRFGVNLSRSYVERILEQGGVTLNDEIIKKKGFKVKEGVHKFTLNMDIIEDMISVYQTGQRRNNEAKQWDASEMGIEIDEDRVARAADIKERIIFENDDIVVVDKPPGVSSHPGKGDRGADTMVYQFIKYMREVHKYVPRAGLLHRLDKDTSGILLFAKNMETYNDVKNQFEARTIQKYYMAKCDRTPRLNNIVKRYIAANSIGRRPKGASLSEDDIENILETVKPIELKGYIARKRGTISMIFTSDSRVARSLSSVRDCISDIFVVYSNETELSMLFVPHTGRTHQIRAQAKYLGAPVQGDPIYGWKNTQEGTLGLRAIGIRFQIKGKDYSFFI